MSRPPQPEPYPGDLIAALPGTVTYRRTYLDPLGRAMRGKVTISGSERHDRDSITVVPVAVTVDLAGGVLEVNLPPGEYRLSWALRSVDGDKATDTDEIVVS